MAKDFQSMKPREVEAYFRQLLLETFGNKVEDEAIVTAKRGAYYISFDFDDDVIEFGFKKKSANKIAKAIRALK